jgi:hypothetical protein
MYHLKMEKQMNNARSARTLTSPELLAGNKNSLLLSLLQVNNHVNSQSTPGKLTTMSGNKYSRHQPPRSHVIKAINPMRIACAPEIS